ncbi:MULTISPECIES: LuxR family transcriptional regulator [Pseudomonas]|uniref:LuxR family transcriptional regulator n=1 Tax=Pseudomonas TaxID=286 RepID=UPI0008772EB8|nr:MULTISPECIES: LuxR family transcriptional regulator [Pseudomonas]BCQ64911.1 LuxR family transcriptional regulator [Pseudomonas sp. Boi14]QEN50198.1 LuxR family transcriptional regulator [Pseudomonas protegens]SCZ75580.1 LuxR family transcriptional regulator [Pseudomonas sp. NFPP17]SDA88015.1 LuxR family transcriptional regulator [Pseudomonas sp. NFPP15]SEM00324.1 LuxR family transcriptional regulator [Pseudomonas sp. NFPP18]
MQSRLAEFDTHLLSGNSLHERMTGTMTLASELGFDALVYDYSPVPFDQAGELIIPSAMVCKTPSDWLELWCDQGYYHIDPVQQVALDSSSPFIWSYKPEAETVLRQALGQQHAPVSSYLHHHQMAHGMTVPIHLPRGGFASLTGLRSGNATVALQDLQQVQGHFTLLAHALQEHLYPQLSKCVRSYPVDLTRRERECLKWAAEGMTSGEIAERLQRSQATINLHLTSAMHKLGARNRVQAVVRAVHYRLLGN